MLDNLKYNIRNNLGDKASDEKDKVVEVAELDWIKFSDNTTTDYKVDVVLGADIVFDPDLLPYLVKTLTILLSNSGVAFIMCCVRNQDTFDQFISLLQASNLKVKQTLVREDVMPVMLVTINS